VDPAVQGRGAGKLLLQSFLAEVRKRGCSGCFLTTDADNNNGVNEFYRRSGWLVESSYTTPEGRKMNRYVFDLELHSAKTGCPGQ
jgi:GNAT superfamily N-acetyltransferase